MAQKIIQKSLFDPSEVSIPNNLTELIKIGINHPAFGVTKNKLKEGGLDILRCLFYGIHNLDLKNFLEIPAILNPGEILSKILAANGLKKGNKHLNSPDIPDDFLKFMYYLDRYSYDKEKFASFLNNFERYFNIEQRARLGLLDQTLGEDFVKSFKFTERKISNRENEFIYDFHDHNWDGVFDGRDRGKYINEIYEKLELLRMGAEQKYIHLFMNKNN